MSDDRLNGDSGSVPSEEHSSEVAVPTKARSGAAWQFPVILASVGAITVAAFFHRDRQAPVADPVSQLATARVALDRADLDEAARWLMEVEPRLAERPDLLGEYHLLVADHRAGSVSPVSSSPPELAVQVVSAYERAVADGAILDRDRRLVIAEAMVAAGQLDEALARIDVLFSELDGPAGGPLFERVVGLRQKLRQGAIEAMVDRREPAEGIRRELASLLAEDVDVEVDAWAVALDARMRLDVGDYEGLAHGLVFEMRRLEGRVVDLQDPMVSVDWAGLWVLLGHAYRDELLLPGRAMECYDVALSRLQASGEVAVQASLSLAGLEIVMARTELRPEPHARSLFVASGHYQAVISMQESTPSERASARIGMALVDVLRDDHVAALEHLAEASGVLLAERGSPTVVSREAVLVALEGAERAGTDAMGGDGVEAVELCDSVVEYAELVARFANEAATRRRGLELIAEARERSAGLILMPHLGVDDPRVERAVVVVPVDVRLEVGRRFAAAASAMDEVEIDMAGDDPDRFRVIWQAATLHDKAGAVEPSLSRYVRFVESQSGESSLWPEAVYRVAAAHHTLRSLDDAEAWYRRLLEGMEGGRDEVSEFTTRAKVGLSRVLMEKGGEAAIPEAESLLNGVLSGTARDAIEPSVPEYRDALLQLVRLLATAGRWSELAGRGDEWLQRYEDDPRWGEVAVRTGRAFLRHADMVADSGSDLILNPSASAARDAEQRRALVMAAVRLGESVDRLGVQVGDGLDPLEAKLLRAAYVDRAVVADRLGNLVEAVRLHRETERRFAGEPIAIIALVMMADAADRAGDAKTAAEATDRARKRLQHLHRNGEAMAAGIEDLGPELVFGPGDETLRRWISAFPPGIGIAVGAEDTP